MSHSRPLPSGIFQSRFKPKYQSSYQLHDNEILDILKSIGIDDVYSYLVASLQYPRGRDQNGVMRYYSPKDYYAPVILNSFIDDYVREKQSDNGVLADEFYIYQIINPKSYHWTFIKTKMTKTDSGYKIDAECEDSMSSTALKANLLAQFESALASITINSMPVTTVNSDVKVKGVQNDGWSCGYWSIRALLNHYIKDNNLAPNQIQQEVLNCDNGNDLRNVLLENYFKYKKKMIADKVQGIQVSVESDDFESKTSSEKDALIMQLLSSINDINKLKLLAAKIYKKEMDFSNELNDCRSIIEEAESIGEYNLNDAILTGRMPLTLVAALTYTGMQKLLELHRDQSYQMISPMASGSKSDLMLMYINQDQSELSLTFPGETARDQFSANVPKSEFQARDPITGDAIESSKVNTVDSRDTTKTIFCPLYHPKGKSSFGMNLGDKETVDRFLQEMGLNKTLEAKYKNGQSKFVIYTDDGLPLFKYYEGVVKDSGKTQENTLYLDERSPLADKNIYLKLTHQGVVYGAVGSESFNQLKHKVSQLNNATNSEPSPEPTIFESVKNLFFGSDTEVKDSQSTQNKPQNKK